VERDPYAEVVLMRQRGFGCMCICVNGDGVCMSVGGGGRGGGVQECTKDECSDEVQLTAP
jgi:hypothetical protein